MRNGPKMWLSEGQVGSTSTYLLLRFVEQKFAGQHRVLTQVIGPRASGEITKRGEYNDLIQSRELSFNATELHNNQRVPYNPPKTDPTSEFDDEF